MAKARKTTLKQVATLTHDKAKRRNIPTAELQSKAQRLEEGGTLSFAPVTYARPGGGGGEREYPAMKTWTRSCFGRGPTFG